MPNFKCCNSQSLKLKLNSFRTIFLFLAAVLVSSCSQENYSWLAVRWHNLNARDNAYQASEDAARVPDIASRCKQLGATNNHLSQHRHNEQDIERH